MKYREIIDCHIHPAIDRETDFCWYAKSGSIKKQFERLKKAGITKACGALIINKRIESFNEIKKLNDAALLLRDRYPDFYIPGIQIHPDFPDDSCREIERCCGKHGVRWIGELVGYLMGFGEDYASKNMLEIMKTAAKYKAVVNFHCSDLSVIEKLCKSFPEVNFVLAHPREREEFIKRISLVTKMKNLYLDCSGTGIDRYGMLKKTYETTGYKKLLFGSDYPINNPAVYIYGAMFEELPEKFYRNFFAENFKQVLKQEIL